MALISHAGGGTRTPDTRIMMDHKRGPDRPAGDSQARQGVLSSDEPAELGAKSGARRKSGSSGPPTKRRHKS
jgi:hypothetical protein